MAKHVLTLRQRLDGCEKALYSRRTPKQLRAAIRKQRDWLRRKLRIG
jgi:hypothetical protein